MPRMKAIAKKPAQTVPPRQGSGRLNFKAKDVQERYECFATKNIFQPYVINLEVLRNFGLFDEVTALLEPPEWKFLLVDFREEIYADLLLEVMATLQVPTQFDLPSTKCIHFSVGRTSFHYSLNELSAVMGFDDLQGLTEEEKGERFLDIPDTQGLWKELTDGKTPYISSSSKSTQFLKREHKFIQYILARSVCGRQESSGTVSHSDLLCLFGLVKRIPIHMGVLLGNLFQNQHSTKVRTLFLGPYITRIIKNSQLVPIREVPLGTMTVITDAIVKRIFPSKKSEKRARTAEEEEEEEDEIEGHEGQVPERGEGSSGSTFQQQVLSQLAAMQLQMGQIYTKVENLETAVARLETREESSAYQAWLRGQFPPSGGPHFPHDPSHPM